jgi:hypothetical protein
MDITEKYIKMSAKSKKVQALRDLKREGDIYSNGAWGIYINSFDPEEADGPSTAEFALERYKTGQLVWLPRQDDLQKMVPSESVEDLINQFISHVLHHPEGSDFQSCWIEDYYKAFDSMEQLWMAFMMSQTEQEFWNGEDWVKETRP